MDGGDFIHRNGKDNFRESVLAWNEMVRSGYHAVTLGELEFGQWDLVDSLMQNTALPVVCTNVEVLRDGEWKQLGERYRVVEVNGIRVGILGVIAPAQLSPSTLRDAAEIIRALPPAEAIQTAVAEILDRTDVIVLLAHVDPLSMEQYGSTLAGVDVVLGGHMTRLDTAPVLASQALVNRSSTRGQNLSVTRLIVSPEGAVVDYGGVNVTLDPEYPEDPEVAKAAEFAKAEGERVVKERIQRRQEEAGFTIKPASDAEAPGGGAESPPEGIQTIQHR